MDQRDNGVASSLHDSADTFEAESHSPSDLLKWGANVGEEIRKTFKRFLEIGFFQRYLKGDHILDIGYKGYLENVNPILPQAIGVDFDYPGYDGARLPFNAESQDAVFSSHTLEHIADYRTAIADWFRVVKVGGHLIIIVPHQFLYERRLEPPSRWNADHKRFYTAGSLLREIEEALPPTAYRVRLVEDNDADYDYAKPLAEPPVGSYEVICVLQKLRTPKWADDILSIPTPAPAGNRSFRVQPQADPDTIEPIRIITSTPAKTDRVLVMKLDHRGDFIMATSAFEALRRDLTHSHLTLLCGSWNVDAARASGLFDEIIAFDYFPENLVQAPLPFKTDLDAQVALEGVLAERRFDLAIDLRLDFETRPLLAAVDSALKAGFGDPARFPYLDISLTLPQPTAGSAMNLFFGAVSFSALLGDHKAFSIEVGDKETSRAAPILIYGPYSEVARGRYSLRFLIETRSDPFQLGFDACCQGGRKVLRVGLIEVSRWGTTAAIDLELPEDTIDLEFRLATVSAEPTPPFRFFGCTLHRVGERTGIHQSEAMLMLATLASARAHRPYVESNWTAPDA